MSEMIVKLWDWLATWIKKGLLMQAQQADVLAFCGVPKL
jgi:hypothetical protein